MFIFRDVLLGQPVLIYQLPKIGSQTIEATLQQWGGAPGVLRFHFLSHTIAGTLRRQLRARRNSAEWERDARGQLQLMHRVTWALRGRKLLSRCGIRLPKLRIITGVRDVISLAVSSLFENYYQSFPTGPAALGACRDALLNPKTLHYIEHWFDLELKAKLGIDVCRLPFDRARGYSIYENRIARLLVFRFEALGSLPVMLREFLGCDISQVTLRNIGATKAYGQAYRYVQENLRLPPDITAVRCHSRMMRHFYSEAECQEFYQRWTELGAETPADLAQVA